MVKDFDGYLDWLANGKQPGGFDVVLNVRGAEVSGTLVTEDEYLEGMRQHLESDAAEVLSRVEAELRQQFSELEQDPDRTEEAIQVGREAGLDAVLGGFERSGEESRYIHLRDVEIRIGIGGTRALWWRGRLSSVDGFVIGSRRASEAE